MPGETIGLKAPNRMETIIVVIIPEIIFKLRFLLQFYNFGCKL